MRKSSTIPNFDTLIFHRISLTHVSIQAIYCHNFCGLLYHHTHKLVIVPISNVVQKAYHRCSLFIVAL